MGAGYVTCPYELLIVSSQTGDHRSPAKKCASYYTQPF